MHIEALGRQMAVCSFEGATRLTRLDKSYWNVVSIHGPRERRADLPLARSIHYACFDDVEEEDAVLGHSARAADIADIFGFIARLDVGPTPAPLLVHCQQGISRSTAVTLSWTYGHLPATADRPNRALATILELQPLAKPNRLVLTLGLAQFMALGEAQRLADQLLSDPRLLQNRSRTLQPNERRKRQISEG